MTCHGITICGFERRALNMSIVPLQQLITEIVRFGLSQSQYGRKNVSSPTRARALQVLKEGIPGTAMPPWEVQMNEAQREAVVAYLDSLYEPRLQ